MDEFELRLVRLEQWRSTRWRDDDLYKKLPLIGERNLVEPTVVSVLRYFLKPGDIAFDVGSQAGHVVHAMSSLVGPRGLVVAFEASVRTARKLLININDANLRNVELVHAAVCARGGERLKLYLHGSQNNDSLFPSEFVAGGSFDKERFVFVDTLSIDEYCAKWDLYPRLMKFDIEGAELEALRGAQQLLSTRRPVVMIEDLTDNLDCFDLLASYGYRCIDLISLKELTRAARADSKEANYLFVHEREPLGGVFTQYLSESRKVLAEEFVSTTQAGLWVSPVIHLPRYSRAVVSWDFAESQEDLELACMLGVFDYKNELIARYQANVGLLKRHYTQLPFECDLDEQIRLFYWTGASPKLPILRSAALSTFR